MAVSYKKLFKLMIDREISTVKLRKMAVISPNTFTKLRKNEYVSLETIDRICDALSVGYDDIMEHVDLREVEVVNNEKFV